MDLQEIVQKYDINLFVIFGSYGTERYRPGSDIDIAFQSGAGLSSADEMSLVSDIMFYFKKDGIDLVNLRKASPLLMYEIACNAKPVYEKGDSFLRFKLKASARYADTKLLRQARQKWLDEQLEKSEQSSGRI